MSRRLLVAIATLLVSLGTPLTAHADVPQDFDIPNGHFFSQANGQGGSGRTGYAVVDDPVAPFWSEFERLGGVDALGYPVSRRFVWDGFLVQAFQKVVFQWRPELGRVSFVNVFDRLSQAGQDPWLEVARATPPSFDHSADQGLAWDDVVKRHLALLDVNPAIKTTYLADADPIQHFGLPMSSKEYDNVFVVRAQRAVFQQWKTDVPWAKAGQVVIANGGDVAKEAGLYPTEALVPAEPGADVVWIRQFGAGNNTWATDVAVDPAGNASVAGQTDGTLGGRSQSGEGGAFVRTIDPAGNDLWTRQFGRSGETRVSLDASGNVYVVAVTGDMPAGGTAPTPAGTFIRKYDPTGNQLWAREAGPVGQDAQRSEPIGIGIDAAGNVYLAGVSWGAAPGQLGNRWLSFIRKYDASGSEVWTRQLGPWGEYQARSAAVDGAGNVSIGGSIGVDSFIRKYDANGTEVWLRRFNVRGSLSGFESLNGFASDRSGSVYAVGVASGSPMSEPRSGAWTAFVRKYDAGGRELWTRQFTIATAPLADGTTAHGLAVDGAGNVFVVGATGYPRRPDGQPPGVEAYVRKYDPGGGEAWTRQFGTPDDDVARSVALDGAGNVFVAGASSRLPVLGYLAFVARLDPLRPTAEAADQGEKQQDPGAPGRPQEPAAAHLGSMERLGSR